MGITLKLVIRIGSCSFRMYSENEPNVLFHKSGEKESGAAWIPFFIEYTFFVCNIVVSIYIGVARTLLGRNQMVLSLFDWTGLSTEYISYRRCNNEIIFLNKENIKNLGYIKNLGIYFSFKALFPFSFRC